MFTCEVETCKSVASYGIYCRNHREMEIKHGTPTPLRLCADPSCDNKFEFQGYLSGIYLKRKGVGQGTAPYCPECSLLLREYKNHPLLYKTIYANVSKVFVIKMLMSQDFSCKACGRSDQPLHVDHDHSCCKERGCYSCVRYLLCRQCNYIAGYLENNLENVLAVSKLLNIKVGIE